MSEHTPVGLEQATDLINAGNFPEALEAARTVLVSHPENVSAKLIEAIALSQMGTPRDASEAFAQAVEMDPTSVKAHFNAAVHEYNVGHLELAQNLLGRALELDPTHAGGLALRQKIGNPAPKTMETAYQRVPASEMEVPYEGIQFVEKLGKTWDLLGWALSLISFALLAYLLAGVFRNYDAVTAALSSQDMAKMKALSGSITPLWYEIADILSRLSLIVWMVMDILHRRSNFLWLLLHIPCSCLNLGFISQPIYMFFGRK